MTRLEDGRYGVTAGASDLTEESDPFLNCYSFNCLGGTAGQTDMKRTDETIDFGEFRVRASYRF